MLFWDQYILEECEPLLSNPRREGGEPKLDFVKRRSREALHLYSAWGHFKYLFLTLSEK